MPIETTAQAVLRDVGRHLCAYVSWGDGVITMTDPALNRPLGRMAGEYHMEGSAGRDNG